MAFPRDESLGCNVPDNCNVFYSPANSFDALLHPLVVALVQGSVLLIQMLQLKAFPMVQDERNLRWVQESVQPEVLNRFDNFQDIYTSFVLLTWTEVVEELVLDTVHSASIVLVWREYYNSRRNKLGTIRASFDGDCASDDSEHCYTSDTGVVAEALQLVHVEEWLHLKVLLEVDLGLHFVRNFHFHFSPFLPQTDGGDGDHDDSLRNTTTLIPFQDTQLRDVQNRPLVLRGDCDDDVSFSDRNHSSVVVRSDQSQRMTLRDDVAT